ncbi:MAG TPA: DUF6265 family protein [Blastocatellia bacterium]|nr:DUF6265 family protein [Blastocatellia bacterium]
MRVVRRCSFLWLILVGCAGAIQAQTASEALKQTTLQDLAFISGRWQAAGDNFLNEEHWSAPAGQSLIGMARMMKDGQTRLYELCVIEQTADGPVLRIRHFRAGMVSLEERPEQVTFQLLDFAKDRAVFEAQDKHARLIYHRTSPQELVVTLDRAGKDERRSTTDFKYRLAP